MMTGEKTQRLSQLFGMSPGRVSQLRREFKEEWDRFTGEHAEPTPQAPRHMPS
jgi:hypothetical protein